MHTARSLYACYYSDQTPHAGTTEPTIKHQTPHAGTTEPTTKFSCVKYRSIYVSYLAALLQVE